ncbi:hypothetical protein ACI2KS_10055 [Pseudomonas sp. NPDC087358]|uniref:hypothetical protein n=1 Tax=Pseudomonas sp. NPDC087358 TaxID=3364439 RepID=UPI00384F3AED
MEMTQELNKECVICLSLGDICVTCEERAVTIPAAGPARMVHRYRVVKMLSEDGNKIDYTPHGPWVVMADVHDAAVSRIQAEKAALQQRLNVADQRVDDLQSELTKARECLKDLGVDWPEVADMYQSAPTAKGGE